VSALVLFLEAPNQTKNNMRFIISNSFTGIHLPASPTPAPAEGDDIHEIVSGATGASNRAAPNSRVPEETEALRNLRAKKRLLEEWQSNSFQKQQRVREDAPDSKSETESEPEHTPESETWVPVRTAQQDLNPHRKLRDARKAQINNSNKTNHPPKNAVDPSGSKIAQISFRAREIMDRARPRRAWSTTKNHGVDPTQKQKSFGEMGFQMSNDWVPSGYYTATPQKSALQMLDGSTRSGRSSLRSGTRNARGHPGETPEEETKLSPYPPSTRTGSSGPEAPKPTITTAEHDFVPEQQRQKHRVRKITKADDDGSVDFIEYEEEIDMNTSDYLDMDYDELETVVDHEKSNSSLLDTPNGGNNTPRNNNNNNQKEEEEEGVYLSNCKSLRVSSLTMPTMKGSRSDLHHRSSNSTQEKGVYLDNCKSLRVSSLTMPTLKESGRDFHHRSSTSTQEKGVHLSNCKSLTASGLTLPTTSTHHGEDHGVEAIEIDAADEEDYYYEDKSSSVSSWNHRQNPKAAQKSTDGSSSSSSQSVAIVDEDGDEDEDPEDRKPDVERPRQQYRRKKPPDKSHNSSSSSSSSSSLHLTRTNDCLDIRCKERGFCRPTCGVYTIVCLIIVLVGVWSGVGITFYFLMRRNN